VKVRAKDELSGKEVAEKVVLRSYFRFTFYKYKTAYLTCSLNSISTKDGAKIELMFTKRRLKE
jgi:hypothetical protein